MIIVIDGPSGSGKSTLAKRLASELNFSYFDTGAMYRSVCFYLFEKKISLEDVETIKKALKDFHYETKGQGAEAQFFVNGQDVSKEIRTREVTNNVSVVAAYPFVREQLVHLQTEFGKAGNAVFEGRDMGTVVFPNAQVKFFLVADPKVRAQRRFEQLKELYPTKSFDVGQIEKEIIERDHYDSNRECSPLRRAKDAIEIDSSHRSIEEVLGLMKGYVEEHKV